MVFLAARLLPRFCFLALQHFEQGNTNHAACVVACHATGPFPRPLAVSAFWQKALAAPHAAKARRCHRRQLGQLRDLAELLRLLEHAALDRLFPDRPGGPVVIPGSLRRVVASLIRRALRACEDVSPPTGSGGLIERRAFYEEPLP